MTAGSGIVHSERTGLDIRDNPSSLFGIQSWMALPLDKEETDPEFTHADKAELPEFSDAGLSGRVIIGEFQGLVSPVMSPWETLYVDLNLKAGSSIEIPNAIEERALYVIGGRLEIAGVSYDPQQMLVLKPGDQVIVKALDDIKVMLLGGAAMDGPRHIWWNFVSSSKDRIEQAKEDWQNRKFPIVPGDEDEFIPLP